MARHMRTLAQSFVGHSNKVKYKKIQFNQAFEAVQDEQLVII